MGKRAAPAKTRRGHPLRRAIKPARGGPGKAARHPLG